MKLTKNKVAKEAKFAHMMQSTKKHVGHRASLYNRLTRHITSDHDRCTNSSRGTVFNIIYFSTGMKRI